MSQPTLFSSTSLVGHPYTPIGMGEHVRCTFRSLRSVARTPRLFDIYRLTAPDETQRTELAPFESRLLSDINIFHINGDEIDQVLAHVGRDAEKGYRVVYPLWELPRYPSIWARKLEQFDEIWAPSRFIRDSIAAVTSRPVIHMPLTAEVVLASFLGRRYFGVPETSYSFLFFFDLRSYLSRKNPQAVIDAFRQVLRARPNANVVLVIKISGVDGAGAEFNEFKEAVADLDDRVVLIDRVMSDNEMKNLVRCCDCFVSLHRSEGFGFGIAQAMFLGKPVVATGWSGNMDFMTPDTSLIVGHRLVPVPEGAYPHWEDQSWADPFIDEAAARMAGLVDSPRSGYEVGRRAACRVRAHFGFRATGMRVASRLADIHAESMSTSNAMSQTA